MAFQAIRSSIAVIHDVSLKLVQKLQTRLESPTPKFVKFALLATPLGLWAWVIHHWNRRSFLNIRLAGHMHLFEIAFKLYAFVYDYSSVKPQDGGVIGVLLRTPLLADHVDTYPKMSTKKHPFKLLHKLYNGLWCLCEINMETAKNSQNRQHYALEALGLKMISLARMWDAKVFTRSL